jgi:endonuclease III
MKCDLGHLDPRILAGMSVQELARAVDRLPSKPRYVHDAPRTIQEVAALVSRDYMGDAERLWTGHTARAVQDTVIQVHGVGPALAAMLVILLERCRGIRFPDHQEMGVKPDVHVQRVLYRLGLATEITEAAALDVTKRMNPSYPGALDSPLWIIGTRWCSQSDPQCSACIAQQVCARRF